MTKFIELEDEAILYYVYNLNWLLPKEIQEEAIEILSKIDPNKADMILPKYGKECWQNGVRVLEIMGYPSNKKALPRLAALLQDRNWPGALEAIELFRSLGKAITLPYIEKACSEAIEQNDLDWLEHLFFACEVLIIMKKTFLIPRYMFL
ncbi:hypothetical protein PZE06_17990 [Robertmurraya sp. DFI.2.37]|uniref:hypothetical protein n=1 Tax=Robertmurraya sp. DFI.2.37 TaxID=3031819 RepID=UPI0023DB55E1|nr:hypothetical protein [Robertmurraya sp. DFI.2.37]MDF1510032.1 hypothetical protein [Robertmurraya sp. DFI.2.37]